MQSVPSLATCYLISARLCGLFARYSCGDPVPRSVLQGLRAQALAIGVQGDQLLVPVVGVGSFFAC